MPKLTFALILLCVICAAGITVWLLAMGRPGLLVAALPAFLIAALAIKVLNK